MTQTFNVLTDVNGIPTGGLQFADANVNYATTLTASVAQTLTVPANCSRAVFSFSPLGVFVSEGAASLSLPSGSFASYAGELNPIDRQVTPGQTLNFISSVTAYVQVRFMSEVNNGL